MPHGEDCLSMEPENKWEHDLCIEYGYLGQDLERSLEQNEDNNSAKNLEYIQDIPFAV